MGQRFFAVERDGKIFIGSSHGGAFSHVTLRDIGASRVWSGTMHASQADAEADSTRKPGPFEGEFVAVVELREVTPDEARDLGAEFSSSPETYLEAFSRRF